MNRAMSFAQNIIERPGYLHFEGTGSALATIHRHLVGVSRICSAARREFSPRFVSKPQ